MSMQRGFTMIETLVVMGIFALIGGLALFVSMETYRSSSFRSDRDLLVAVLQRARAQAINNVCFGTCTDNDGQPHGVRIESDQYIIFQGDTYSSSDPNNAAFDSNPLSNRTGATEIVFEQLSGDTSCSPTCEISLTQGSQSSVISVTSNGRISWTN